MDLFNEMISIIIPAHNEESVIANCLDKLLANLSVSPVQVIVVCNGCNDRTELIARSYGEPVDVVSIDEASKSKALNCGDARARYFPRIYLDADVVLNGSDLIEIVGALKNENILAVAPKLAADTSRSSWAVRAYYKVWLSYPYHSDMHMVGSGVYALSERGRQRFSKFPDIISDDGYIRALFSPTERKTIPECRFYITAPTGIEGVVKIKTRARFGNTQLGLRFPEMASSGKPRIKPLFDIFLRHPGWTPEILVFMYVQIRTMLNARLKLAKGDYSTWERDDTSRQ